MKKLLFVLLLGISAAVYAEDAEPNILNELKELNTSYEELLQKEKERFLLEKERALVAKEDLVKLQELKEKIETTLNNQKEERKQRFFKDDFDKLISQYKNYLSDVNNEIADKEKIISDFEIINQMSNDGNN